MIFGINNIMKNLLYINYFIYKFYEKKDPDPFIYSFFGSSLLVSLNLISVLVFFQEFLDFQFSKYYSILVLFLSFIYNYFYIYRDYRYKEIFFQISKECGLKRKLLFFLIYLFFTIGLILFIIIYIRIKKFGAL